MSIGLRTIAFQNFCSSPAISKSRPPVFASHSTTALNGPVEVGVHPNFLPGSAHGPDPTSVINRILAAFPQAKASRSHHLVDSSDTSHDLFQRGLAYDSNLGLHFQEGIVPLQMGSGPIRFPVFWEDDVHWSMNSSHWRVENFLDRFTSPGLKILNIHPFFFAANIPSQNYYERVKQHVKTLSAETVRDVRYVGPGVRTFAETLLKELRNRGFRFQTLHQLYELTRSQLKAELERSDMYVSRSRRVRQILEGILRRTAATLRTRQLQPAAESRRSLCDVTRH
jgi:hypothetical protein